MLMTDEILTQLRGAALHAEIKRLTKDRNRWHKAAMDAGVIVCDGGELAMPEEIADYERGKAKAAYAERDEAIAERDEAQMLNHNMSVLFAEQGNLQRSELRAAIAERDKLRAALKPFRSAGAALSAYEADYGDELPADHEIGRIEESQGSPSFRIRVGHIRILAALTKDIANG
jgi:hypothetical protein